MLWFLWFQSLEDKFDNIPLIYQNNISLEYNYDSQENGIPG